ncbi:unnamed protein product [Brachionus calyciflorus]|uniref:Uncharacterized protein n=1 Tax=Brachionus calyciflorus TaxID=104777 RepID=A0A814I799_9BILA|nr:unnamed protein product [Brachionus calyciflorus]
MLSIILLFFIIKLIDSSPNKQCPYPLCKTTYINSSFCSIYCSENTIPDPCLAKINQIDGFILNNVSYLKKDAFNNVDVNFLKLQNSDLKNVSELAFRGIKNLTKLTLYQVTNIHLFFDDKIINDLNGKIVTLNLYRIPSFKSNILNEFIFKIDEMSLKEFTLDNTKLVDVDLDLNRNKNLKKLYLRSDQIKSFKMNVNQYLEFIDLFNNNIEIFEITSGSYSKLTYLNLNRNFLSSIKFANLKNLSKLILDSNYIRNTSRLNLDILIGLNDLSIALNQIESIDFMSLKKLTKLQTINLNDNFLTDSANFSDLKYLISLQLARNKLKSVISHNFKGLESLLNLDLSQNEIEFIELNVSSLIYLSLEGNKIKFFDSKLLVNLESINLSDNFLSELFDLVNFQSLKEIFLTKNRIKNLTYYLELFYNHSKIYLSNNLLENLPIFPKFENLNEIYLSKNKLSIIEKETFKNLKDLEILDLYGNMIFLIDPLAFSMNRKLRTLNLADNNLNKIPKLNKLENLEFFYLTNQSSLIELFDYDFNLSTNKNLRIYLSKNQFKYIHSKAFCSKENVDLDLYLDNVNLLHHCMLNQFNGKNVNVTTLEKANCFITKIAEIKSINLNEKSNCDNFDFVVDCDRLTNLKYDCNSGILDYERETKWLYSVNPEFIKNTQDIFYNCIGNLFYQIKCSFFQNSSFISQIYLCEKEQCFGIDNGNLFKKDFMIKNFHIISLTTNVLVFYHVKTSTFFITQQLNGSYFIILRALKVILENSTGFLINGSMKNQSYVSRINFSMFKIIDNDIEKTEYDVKNSIYDFKKLLSLDDSLFAPYVINLSLAYKFNLRFYFIGILFIFKIINDN